MSASFPPDTPYNDHDDLLTLTQKKAHADAAQALGRQMTKVSAAHFESLPLEGRLREALLEARRITHRGGLARQLQFVGRLMRSADTDALRCALERGPSRKADVARITGETDAWVKRLTREGRAGIEEFSGLAPQAERTRLAQLTRQLGKANTPQTRSRCLNALRTYMLSVWRSDTSEANPLD